MLVILICAVFSLLLGFVGFFVYVLIYKNYEPSENEEDESCSASSAKKLWRQHFWSGVVAVLITFILILN